MNNKYISFIADGIMAGFFLCIGCVVSKSVASAPLGAFLFSLGLFAIITFKFGLYTGKAGYMAIEPPSYIAEVAITLASNVTGTALGSLLINMTRFGASISIKAAESIAPKLTDNPLSIFILAVFCGALMYTAVEGNRHCAEQGNYAGALFAVVMPVMVFISCGFNHCVADSAYFFLSRCANAHMALNYFPFAVLGNAAGCMLIPMMKKLSLNH